MGQVVDPFIDLVRLHPIKTPRATILLGAKGFCFVCYSRGGGTDSVSVTTHLAWFLFLRAIMAVSAVSVSEKKKSAVWLCFMNY